MILVLDKWLNMSRHIRMTRVEPFLSQSSPARGRWRQQGVGGGGITPLRYGVLPLRQLRCHLPLAGED